jgi:hypothetical protein
VLKFKNDEPRALCDDVVEHRLELPRRVDVDLAANDDRQVSWSSSISSLIRFAPASASRARHASETHQETKLFVHFDKSRR